jgi:hypothetical protein
MLSACVCRWFALGAPRGGEGDQPAREPTRALMAVVVGRKSGAHSALPIPVSGFGGLPPAHAGVIRLRGYGAEIVIPGRSNEASPESIFQRTVFMDSGRFCRNLSFGWFSGQITERVY